MDDLKISDDLDNMINNATNDKLETPDYESNIAIVEYMNQHRNSADILLSILIPRLVHRMPIVGILTINLLDMILKNCSFLRYKIANISFLEKLLYFAYNNQKSERIGPVESDRRTKALSLLEYCANQYGTCNGCESFNTVYQHLQKKGFFSQEKQNTLPRNFTNKTAKVLYENALVLEELIKNTSGIDNLKHNNVVQTMLRNLTDQCTKIQSFIQIDPSNPSLDEFLNANDYAIEIIGFYNGVINGTRTIKKINPQPSISKKVFSTLDESFTPTHTPPSILHSGIVPLLAPPKTISLPRSSFFDSTSSDLELNSPLSHDTTQMDKSKTDSSNIIHNDLLNIDQHKLQTSESTIHTSNSVSSDLLDIDNLNIPALESKSQSATKTKDILSSTSTFMIPNITSNTQPLIFQSELTQTNNLQISKEIEEDNIDSDPFMEIALRDNK